MMFTYKSIKSFIEDRILLQESDNSKSNRNTLLVAVIIKNNGTQYKFTTDNYEAELKDLVTKKVMPNE